MLDLNINQGSDYSIALTIKDSAGVGIDLTGFEFSGQVKLKYTDEEPVLTFAFAIAPNQTTDKGKVEMTLPREQTEALILTEITQYLYDVEMKNTDDKVKKILEGNAFVTPEVTK